MLKATDERNDFAANMPGGFTAFINGPGLANVTISGPGTIDGSGGKWWVPAEEARQKKSGYTLPRPNLIMLTGCKNVRLENLTLQNSPKFHFVPTECEGVVVSNVTIIAPPRSPNTNAIDPSSCKNVLITRCRITWAMTTWPSSPATRLRARVRQRGHYGERLRVFARPRPVHRQRNGRRGK